MSYTLTPVIIDLPAIRALMGSKDTAVLQAVIKKHRSNMLDTDAMGDSFDEFEREIKAEYKAFVAGDFSHVELNGSYPERESEQDTGDDEETRQMTDLVHKLAANAPGAKEELNAMLQGLFESATDDDSEEDEDEYEPVKELTTGAALVHLIMGGNPDPSLGYKYGYALCSLCMHLGKVPKHDAWCSIRYRSVEEVDSLLKKAGVSPKLFSATKTLLERGAPVQMPEPDDFPAIGYVERSQIGKLLEALDDKKIQPAINSSSEDIQEWLTEAMAELRSWLEASAKADRDLICFYS